MKKQVLLVSCAVGVLAFVGQASWAGEAAAAAATTPAPAADNSAGTTIGELVVTAERKEENLQDTPIAVSAFSQDTLSKKGLVGGQDLLLQIPNANYSRSNFGGFNLKIRGIGVDVIAATGTTGVSINENELPVSDNNFANANFFDVQRVEVLRGPQGTLYGRNATGGAVDVITNQPTSDFGGYATAGYGNYNAVTLTGAVNLPLGDAFALRVAGYRYAQDGFGVNTYLNQRIDNRDLGAVRATLSFKPNERFSAYLMFEHYGEDDARNRVGKQLCYKDPGPTNVGGLPIAPAGGPVLSNYAAFLNQGCLPGNLNSPGAFGTPNSNATFLATGNLFGLNNGKDVFVNADGSPQMQTDHNLHDAQSLEQPTYKSNEDLAILHLAYKLTDHLTLTSITGFNQTRFSAGEDYNRIVPNQPFTPVGDSLFGPLPLILYPTGVVNDPQIGPSNRLATFDLETLVSKEYTEEVRLASSFDGRINFSGGFFFSENDRPRNDQNYYVYSNALTAAAQLNNFVSAFGGAPPLGPIHIDPNAIPTGEGHNYYDNRSGSGYLHTYAGFGEVYYDITKDLKLTLGGRYTIDSLYNLSPPISVLVGQNNGTTPYPDGYGGFPTNICTNNLAQCTVPQRVTYREFTGRANLDWTPTLSFTDKTLIYASYSRGYKGGGFNTPCQSGLGTVGTVGNSCPYPLSYAPEFINAYEIGTKNTLMNGSLTLNLDGFYYDYSGYQISEIVAKSSVNLNINAKIYGVEFESVYSPIRNMAVNLNVGYLHTAIDSGQKEIDQIDLAQGNPAYTLLHGADGTACLANTAYLAQLIAGGIPAPFLATGGPPGADNLYAPGACAYQGFGTTTGANPTAPTNPYQTGIPVDLGGKKLPNTPEFTVSVGAQYTFELPHDWNATLRGDYYWQDNSYARIFNAVNDRLNAYDVVNATLTFNNKLAGVQVQLFVKNLFDSQPITGTYLTNDTSGLFQNVFTLDPRTYGVQVTKRF